jgi:hypothetical protein
MDSILARAAEEDRVGQRFGRISRLAAKTANAIDVGWPSMPRPAAGLVADRPDWGEKKGPARC